MKSCPVCHSTYPRDFSLCPRDGTKLVEVGVWTEGTLVRGKYRILGKLGEGGMAAVYKALHVRFDELRALKVISADLSSDPSFIKRLQQEAVVTRRLQHPNAVRVEDIDEAEDGRPFIVMEYIEGRSLKEVIEEAPLPVDRTCRIVKQVASALDAAHSLGILHRDIKPANIVLVDTPHGEQAKVLDFGIAKVKEANLGETAEMTLTGKGRVVGTSAYMSPEQAMGMRGDELDGRSDLYSLGVVMYQMLVGELPLKAESEVTMLMAHIQRPPDPILPLRPDLPPFIADLVMSLLEKKRELRPANGRALIEQIERWERGETAGAQPAIPSSEQTILYREAFREEPPLAAQAAGEEEGTRKLPGFSRVATSPPVPASAAGAWGSPSEAAPPSPPSRPAETYPEVEATMLASDLSMNATETPRPAEHSVPLASPSSPPEPYAEGEATMLAAGLAGGGAGIRPPEPIPPVSPQPTVEHGGGAWESVADAGATMLASGFGAAGERSYDTPPPPPPTPEQGTSEGFSGGGATMFAGGFDTASQHQPAPSYSPPEGGSNAGDSYPPGEATMLAQSLTGEPLRLERGPTRGFEAVPSSDLESPPAGELSSPEASGLGPESGMPGGDATGLVSGGALPWESAAPPSEASYAAPVAGAGWTEPAPPSSIPTPEVQAPPAVEPLPPAPRKAGWAVWAAVPLVAVVLGVGAWYFLTHTRGPQTSAPPATPSSAPQTTATPPADSGTAQHPSGQAAPGSVAPPARAPAEGSATGAASTAQESKPTETKPEEAKAEKKPVDVRAVQALRAEGDLDYDKGQYDDAIRAYRKGLALDPGNRMLMQQINRARKAKQTEEKLLH